MAGRLYFAWRMLATATARDERNYNTYIDARARNSFDPLVDLTGRQFVKRYRLTKKVFRILCKELRQFTKLRSSQRVSLELKVLTALLFYATGSYQRPIGVAKRLSQKMCSVYIEEVTQALTHYHILNKYIHFPSTPTARRAVSLRFYLTYGIPGVIGCIDGSHFKIVVPRREEEHLYYSRKHYHSLNVQMICDDKLQIININPKFGGANHDSFIWENSIINNYMQDLHRNGEMVWLLGDSGYLQCPWLMTPILDDHDRHMKAMVLIENTFSRLKNRWRCLHKDRVLHYKPLKCARIIQACSVLHNLCLKFNIREDLGLDIETNQETEHPYIHTEREMEAASDLILGRIVRSQLVSRL